MNGGEEKSLAFNAQTKDKNSTFGEIIPGSIRTVGADGFRELPISAMIFSNNWTPIKQKRPFGRFVAHNNA